MTISTIRQIKQQIQQLTNGESNNRLPSFWLTDWLLCVIDKPAIALMTDEDYQLTDSEVARFNDGVVKMQQGIPLAYLTGQQEFWSLNFRVNEHTLIPRPDTEVLVEQVLNWINAQPIQLSNKRLLDLGTGSGCIAISLAHELKKANWQVVAVDLSSEALKVAQHNAVSNSVANVEFVQSSWYQTLPTNDERQFDIIVSNPPYIDETDEHLAGLTAEPISALSAPNQGLADIEHIVQQATMYLRTGGLLTIEHGYDQGDAVRKLFLDNGFESVHTVKDYGGNDRVTLGQVQ
ncbi:peptide chain release factor N(5)-glutamine methyltransferase [Psychrobacter sp. MES7-P7E]|uniref:peptide chain release factor N(5)-glutamine methyltransferase n=1 Tax=Psychrobacter sp. MES7-P7E TaxID=2058322 RepID=UPI000C7E9848|nr:peptide chain release factor N(5)-glutamine methyltransferase [Psychrobacter sp. MES7-P7E]PLT22839.1 peptide chain release factor N(5)-glutamine methyltransferase [Psychrobacter sp. MES7-P7E]